MVVPKSRSIRTVSASRRPDAPQKPQLRPVSPIYGYILFAAVVGSFFTTYVYAQYLNRNTSSAVPPYLNAAIPHFVALLFIEAFLLKVSGYVASGGSFEFGDTWGNLTAGMTEQILNKLLVPYLVAVLPYSEVWSNWRIFDITDYVPYWVALPIAFITWDFVYYYFHQICHRNGVLWMGHAIHHESETYNLSTALRQSFVQTWTGNFFYLPFALFIPFEIFWPAKVWNTIYQFWVHTCLIRRLPWWFEAVMMTPSHHRVHHDRRVHKNHGGILVIWDKLCGTFLDEDDNVPNQPVGTAPPAGPYDDEKCLFGTATPLTSHTEAVLQTLHGHRILRNFANAWYGPGYVTTFTARKIMIPGEEANTPGRLTSRKRLQVHGLGSAATSLYYYWVLLGTVLMHIPILHEAHPPASIVFKAILCMYLQALVLDGHENALWIEVCRVLCILHTFALPGARAAYSSTLTVGSFAAWVFFTLNVFSLAWLVAYRPNFRRRD